MEKMVKQRKVSVSQFEAANREDLASIERAEIVVIQGYLPEKLDEATILAAIDDAIARTGASGPADMGKQMGVLKPKLAGQADMGQVSAPVKKKLAKGPCMPRKHSTGGDGLHHKTRHARGRTCRERLPT